MKLSELLMVLDYRQSIIIVNLEKNGNDAFSKKMKVGNINIERLRNIGSMDVYTVQWSESNECFLVRIGDKQRTKTSLAVYGVVDTRLEQLGLVNGGSIVRVMP